MANFIYMTKAKWKEICDEIRKKTKYTGNMTAEEARQKIAEITGAGITIDEIVEGTSLLNERGTNIETNVTKVVPAALYKTNIESFKGPNIKYIGERAFYGCEYLAHLDLPKLYQTYEYAFAEATDLRGYFEFPNLEYVGDYTFRGSAVGIVNIPKARYLNEGSFYSCYRLVAVEVGDNISIIDKDVFKDCYDIEALVINATEPPSLNGELGGNFDSSGAYIYVPSGSIEAYKDYEIWRDYGDNIKPISEYTRPSI